MFFILHVLSHNLPLWRRRSPPIAKKIEAPLFTFPRVLSRQAGSVVGEIFVRLPVLTLPWHMSHRARTDEGLHHGSCVFRFRALGGGGGWSRDRRRESPSCLRQEGEGLKIGSVRVLGIGYKTPKELSPCRPREWLQRRGCPAPSLHFMSATQEPFSDSPLRVCSPSSREPPLAVSWMSFRTER